MSPSPTTSDPKKFLLYFGFQQFPSQTFAMEPPYCLQDCRDSGANPLKGPHHTKDFINLIHKFPFPLQNSIPPSNSPSYLPIITFLCKLYRSIPNLHSHFSNRALLRDSSLLSPKPLFSTNNGPPH